ncbi:hypothetical protein C1Y11_07385 [Pseudomonas sp. FW305-20]|nr:hypothetical protein C1Y11_07385 [Pseudomonas sp. FW305-20]PMU21892.1 hypothetical protein C1Y10_01805 [Pseudomonas sp. FW305-122]PMU43910.1 hypothetical protein C1Y12_00780 [Pseudomonas sp. FW305-47B]PMX63009.1 hypothetical protein C1Y13_07255 [Pseudomonas sp. FW305-33]PMX69637.1 hypothetical protein C1X12_06765 [Pseudomonas sp. FW305-60]
MGMPQGTLRVPVLERDAERPGLHSHAERGNDQALLINIQLENHVSSAAVSRSTSRGQFV